MPENKQMKTLLPLMPWTSLEHVCRAGYAPIGCISSFPHFLSSFSCQPSFHTLSVPVLFCFVFPQRSTLSFLPHHQRACPCACPLSISLAFINLPGLDPPPNLNPADRENHCHQALNIIRLLLDLLLTVRCSSHCTRSIRVCQSHR